MLSFPFSSKIHRPEYRNDDELRKSIGPVPHYKSNWHVVKLESMPALEAREGCGQQSAP